MISFKEYDNNLKKWFGKSKVKKGNKPLVVYHGSSHEFDTFTLDAPPIAKGTIRGFYFTEDKSEAKQYGKVIIPVYLSLQNMLEANPYDFYAKAHDLKPLGFGSTPEDYAAWKKVTPNVVRKFIEKKGEGVHHIAYEVDDIRLEMTRLKNEGFQLLNEEPKKGADNKLVCFIHPKSVGGVLVELCQELK